MTPELFSQHVSLALDDLPRELREKMENVEVIVEDLADAETLQSMGIGSPFDLLGLYVGVPIDRRSVFSSNPLPDRIHLYRIPILRASGGKEDLVRKIREVTIHEVGHHFGFDDRDLDAMAGSSV